MLVRRLVTIIPALIILASGANPTQALVWSQVLLSMGLPDENHVESRDCRHDDPRDGGHDTPIRPLAHQTPIAGEPGQRMRVPMLVRRLVTIIPALIILASGANPTQALVWRTGPTAPTRAATPCSTAPGSKRGPESDWPRMPE
jgi:hypothetical protein